MFIAPAKRREPLWCKPMFNLTNAGCVTKRLIKTVQGLRSNQIRVLSKARESLGSTHK